MLIFVLCIFDIYIFVDICDMYICIFVDICVMYILYFNTLLYSSMNKALLIYLLALTFTGNSSHGNSGIYL